MTGPKIKDKDKSAQSDQPVSELRTDGPTIEEYIAAGYRADQYPPAGYAVVTKETRTGRSAPATDLEKAKLEDERQANLLARQQDIDEARSDLQAQLDAVNADTSAEEKADLNAKSTELDRLQSVLDKEKALPPGTLSMTIDDARRDLIMKLEKAGFRGHGLDSDRYLMKLAAQHLRRIVGLGPEEPVAPPDHPLAPVTYSPPMGHSLPGPDEPVNIPDKEPIRTRPVPPPVAPAIVPATAPARPPAASNR